MHPDLQKLIDDLKQHGFGGDIETDYGARVVAATDNSIYQLTPQAIFYPREEADINRVMRLVHRHRGSGFSISARGGGTGTNGQSLTSSLVLDCSRHLNQIIDFDAAAATVTVQPGVVLDQLNEYLAPTGLFFPIDISSSSRATLGGMVATDASGKGSLVYGKTSDHIAALDVVLADGSDYRARQHRLDDFTAPANAIPDFLLPIFQRLSERETAIKAGFPAIDRGMTGYDIKQAIATPDVLDPCRLLAGSEGTLALTRRITLRLSPRPTQRLLTVIFYRDFTQALAHVPSLLQAEPSAIEMLDDKVLAHARDDQVWHDLQTLFGDVLAHQTVGAVNYVEFSGQDASEIASQATDLDSMIKDDADAFGIVTFKRADKPTDRSALWNLRKRVVGLLGRSQNGKRGIAFVEDSAVPVQELGSYIQGFRQILDAHNLDYGMYGHADAGVLHVRPVLDMYDPTDRGLIRRISDQVAQLAKDHHGVLWGEHGRGFRGEYAPMFFGDTLYPLLCDIKQSFDPFNLLNPGKLVAPDTHSSLTPLDAVPYRGAVDSAITPARRLPFSSSFDCNGNGVCLHYSTTEAMCPSYRATRNKLYSPKGRAALFREWLRLREQPGSQTDELKQVEASLMHSLQSCLSCKSCASSCPLQVDIPELKSRFLDHWRQNHRSPLSDGWVHFFDRWLSLASHFPALANAAMNSRLATGLQSQLFGLCDTPRFSRTRLAAARVLNKPSKQLPDNAVILLRDRYVDAFERELFTAAARLLEGLGWAVYFSLPLDNGKLLHVKGYRDSFAHRAKAYLENLDALQHHGAPLLSIETVSRLMHSSEFPSVLEMPAEITITSIEQFLAQKLPDTAVTATTQPKQQAVLFPHCMEQTAARESAHNWQTVFKHFGLDLEVRNAGCCGMSGLFGHETNNRTLARDIFSLHWQPPVTQVHEQNGIVLASGFSCRSQLRRFDYPTLHPLQFLDRHVG